MELPTIVKVTAMITRGSELLVFRKPEHPGTGTQVPAGTVEPGEPPEVAVVREAIEETGLKGFTLLGLLDHRLIDARPYGRNEFHDRWFFHLGAPDGTLETWRHGESDPSEGDETFIPFDFFWVDLFGPMPELRELGPVLPVLRSRLG